uniref:NR LBD domain-containing protein n=1 Tax=Timema shepardi TaxID=629360 RepID=A0A7R9B6S6_TIMSH|nr:unnamed protein product [Timema shepardi]
MRGEKGKDGLIDHPTPWLVVSFCGKRGGGTSYKGDDLGSWPRQARASRGHTHLPTFSPLPSLPPNPLVTSGDVATEEGYHRNVVGCRLKEQREGACPLNPNPQPLTGQQELLQDFSKRFSPAIRGVVEFAKRIPGFGLLPQDDQVTLLKAGVFEVLLVRLACMFDAQTNSMICLNGQVLKRESIHNSSNARFLMDSMFDFAERLNTLRLSDAEVGLFCSVVVIAPDRPGLRNTDLIERMQSKLRSALQAVVAQNHPGHPTVKSPLGSVSSTESVCSGEVASLTEYHHHHQASSAPLLAATLAGGVCPHRHRANSGSTSGDDDMMGLAHLGHHGLTITTVAGPAKSLPQHHPRFRKLDSPSDSGIESGTEKLDKLTPSGTNSAPTSVCSSPRSSMEDKDEDKHHHHHHHHHGGSQIVEDMPVLKRVLQAPPLYDTNSLMDEAYKPHKKFRALRNKDSAEAEPMVVASPQPPASSSHHSSPQLHHHLTSNTTQSSLSSTHSTLAKSLMEGPRMTAEQLKRTDIIHNYIMRGDNGGGDYPPPSGPPLHKVGHLDQQQQQPSTEFSRIYFHPQSSPHHAASSSTSPSPLHRKTPPSSSPHLSSHSSPTSTATLVVTTTPSSPKMMELQVDIADSQQPLNLSKKSPSPSPRPIGSPATLSHKIVSLEA